MLVRGRSWRRGITFGLKLLNDVLPLEVLHGRPLRPLVLQAVHLLIRHLLEQLQLAVRHRVQEGCLLRPFRCEGRGLFGAERMNFQVSKV